MSRPVRKKWMIKVNVTTMATLCPVSMNECHWLSVIMIGLYTFYYHRRNNTKNRYSNSNPHVPTHNTKNNNGKNKTLHINCQVPTLIRSLPQFHVTNKLNFTVSNISESPDFDRDIDHLILDNYSRIIYCNTNVLGNQ